VDWLAAEWIKGGQPFAPDFGRSLKDNGVGHKDLLRFRTPGLNTLCGTAPA
jgi:phenol hydroxylase P4 protein